MKAAISGATYNAANHLVSIPAVFNGIQPTGQSWTYNALNQLTSISYGPNTAFQYNYNDGQNKGQNPEYGGLHHRFRSQWANHHL